MMEKGMNYDVDVQELLKDTKKYRIAFNSDFVYDFDDEQLMKTLDLARKEENEDKFKEAFNKYAEKNNLSYKIKLIYTLCGPGGGWPDIEFETTKPMTFKNIIKNLSEEYCGGDEEEAEFMIFGNDLSCDIIDINK